MEWTLNRTGSRPIPIPWKLREDIQWFSRGTDHGEWIAKDPLSTKFYRFGHEERKLLDWIDGHRSIAEIEEKFHSEFRPKHIDRQDLIRLLQTAIQRGLLTFRGRPSESVNDSTTQGVLTWLTALPWKLLFSRISLGNPQHWLDHPWLKMNWLFSSFAVRIWLTVTFATLCLLLSRWSDLWTRWPSWQQLMQPSTWLGMGTAFVLTRSIHELSHAVVCRRLGARCSDVGLLFMSGIACPYVDVSDSWRLSNRWHRAAIAMAGVYAELIVGSLAGLFWLMTYESWLNYFAFQIMLVCTISTLLFNANPLMRYDGYYTLCDLLETPNLRERADRIVGRLSASLFLGIQPVPRWNRINLFLLLFGTLAACYRFLFLFGMMNAVIASARYWNVPWLGWSIAMLIVVSALLIPLYRALQFTLRSWRHENFRQGRAILSWVSFVVLFVLATILPIPVRVPGHGILVPADRVSVFAPGTGWIEPAKPSEVNSKTDLSSNIVIAEQQMILHSRTKRQKRRFSWQLKEFPRSIRNLPWPIASPFHDQSAMTRIPILEATLTMARKQLQAKQEQSEQLSIVSPCSGVWRAASTQKRSPLFRVPPHAMVAWRSHVAARTMGSHR